MINPVYIKYIDHKNLIEKDKFINLLSEIGNALPTSLSEKVKVDDYAEELLNTDELIIALYQNDYVGLLAYYDNDIITRKSYVSILSIKTSFQRMGIGSALIRRMEEHAIRKGMIQNSFHIQKRSQKVINFCKLNGYVIIDATENSFVMAKLLNLSFGYKTPIIRLPSVNLEADGIEITTKLDGLFAYPYGGNKGRKAIYFLNYALYNNYTHLVTNGAIDSNHVRAIAIGCEMLGLQCHIILHYDKGDLSYYNNINYKILRSLTCNVKICKSNEIGKYMDDEIELIKNEGGKPLYIWGGGHSPLGTMAYYDAFEEYISQLGDSEIRPNYIFLATGTGTTQAGLLAGNRGRRTKIVGVSISRDKERQTKVIEDSLDDFYSYFGIEKQTENEGIIVLDNYIGSGYASVEAQVINIINSYMKEGIILDPVYTGKAFYGMLQEIKNKKIGKGSRILFWHTGGFMNYLAYKDSI